MERTSVASTVSELGRTRRSNTSFDEQLDNMTFYMQEGKLISGKELVRPYSGRPTFVGSVTTGFGGD